MNSYPNTPLLILIAGSSGSGKSTVANEVLSRLPESIQGITICQDRYYIDRSQESDIDLTNVNFDHPTAFDWQLMKQDLHSLVQRKGINLPEYDYVNHCRIFSTNKINAHDIIILEGIHAFFDDEINKLADLMIFIEVPRDESFIRRLERDVNCRGRTIDSVINQWRMTVRPMYDAFIEPLKYKADIIIPWNHSQNKAIEIISRGIIDLLNKNELLSTK